MFQLTAIFNKNNLTDVLQELSDRQIPGATITDVIGKGAFAYDSVSDKAAFDENVMLLIIVPDETIKESAKEAIRANTQDISASSGKMWVTKVLEVERIRTGDTDEAAISPTQKVKHLLHDDFFTHEDTPSS